MNNRSNEIIKQLNRFANDRSLPTQARNRINDAVRHIREQQFRLSEAINLSEV
jgi:hypothetical protein